jgi:hypothetical protein
MVVQMNPKVCVLEISLKKTIGKFGSRLVELMDHSGILLFLILHPEEIEVLTGAEAIGLEVNLPAEIDVYLSNDDLSRGRRKPKVDLIFRKENIYYLIQVVDRKYVTQKEKEMVEDFARRFEEILGESGKSQVIPIIVKTKEKGPTSAHAELLGLLP